MRFVCVFVLGVLFVINYLSNDCFYKEKIVDFSCDWGLTNCEISASNYEMIFNKLNVVIINKRLIEDRLIIEGYSSEIGDSVMVNGVRVNIQVSVCDDKCILGIPLIKNSFWCIEKIYLSIIRKIYWRFLWKIIL